MLSLQRTNLAAMPWQFSLAFPPPCTWFLYLMEHVLLLWPQNVLETLLRRRQPDPVLMQLLDIVRPSRSPILLIGPPTLQHKASDFIYRSFNISADASYIVYVQIHDVVPRIARTSQNFSDPHPFPFNGVPKPRY
jgi:hypothetical protein